MKYRIYATKGKIIFLSLCCWILGIVSCVISSIYHLITNNMFYFLAAPWILVLLLLCVFTYVIIFKGLIKSKRKFARNSSRSRNISVFNIFRNSRMYTSVLLVGSYLFCWVVPAVVLGIAAIFPPIPAELSYAMGTVTVLNYLFDPFIYIYLDNDVRKLMWRKIHVMKCISWKTQPVQRRPTVPLRAPYVIDSNVQLLRFKRLKPL